MQRFGKGFMFVSALLWVVAGAIVFSSPRSGDAPMVAQAIDASHVIGLPAQAGLPQVASANSALPTAVAYDTGASPMPAEDTIINSTVSDGSGGNTWEGPFYVNNQAADIHTADMAMAPDKPWYVQYFGGFGSMFQSLFSNDANSSYGGAVSQLGAPAKQLPPACTISIIPNSVPYGGSATVTWTSRNADHVIFQGIGEVARSGSVPVKQLTSTRALALAVVGAQGLSSSCYTVVNVEPLVVDKPTCVISGNPSTIKKGESVNISWGSQNASSATLAEQGPVATVGGTTLTPTKTTTYTLAVESVVGDAAECDTTVEVK